VLGNSILISPWFPGIFRPPRELKISGAFTHESVECYVGTAPGLFYGGCHGLDEQAVFAELCRPPRLAGG
jgi:hypothetical protein